MCICESDEFGMIKGLDPFVQAILLRSLRLMPSPHYSSSKTREDIFYDVHILGKAISASHCLNGDRPTIEVICYDTDLLA